VKPPSEVAALVELFGYRDAAKEVDGGWWSSCPVARENGDGPIHCGEKMFVALQEDGSGRYEPTCGHSVDEVRAAVASSNGKPEALSPGNTATPQHPPKLASTPRILDEFAQAVHRAGLVGEDRNAKIIYLAATSRLLEQFRPVSVAIKGQSSGGKSYTVERTLDFFPDEAYKAYTAMSDKALAYLDKSLAHRMLVVYEAAAFNNFNDGIGEMLLRSLLSEGHIHYQTVTDGKPVELELAGPTGLIVTTTQKSLHPENESRLLSLAVTDTPAQTKAIMRGIASQFMGTPDEEIDLAPWHEMQDWLWWRGAREVVIPFAAELAEKTQETALRLRRDFGQMLALVATHAVLHQASRELDDHGRVVATIDDYAVIRELTGDLFAEALDEAVRPATREVVAKVRELNEAKDEHKGVSVTEMAAVLGLHKGTVSRRLDVAAFGGYVVNLEERRGRKARYVLGDPLPEGSELLPDPEVLHCCTVAGGGGGVDPDAELERLREKGLA
jgi:hypothetical protein